MCGIFALINPRDCPVDLPACRLGTEMMEHRGPDAYGEWISESQDTFLGHRRLSIIDLSAASSQPMVGDSGQVLIYNGEIFNFRSIRRDLESYGCKFRSCGDTEVLLRALETWGTECLTKLEGMFAFVLWDPGRDEVLLARDFFGIKPLYFLRTPDGALTVSSEIKAFYALPNFSPEFDPTPLPEFLQFRSLCDGRTLLRGVSLVKPGHVLNYNRSTGNLTHSSYWDPVSILSGQVRADDTEVLRGEFVGRFRDTLERHLIADAPIGLQLSGGLDSSLVAAVGAHDLKRPLTGFHCQVSHREFDEAAFAEQTARYLGCELLTAPLTDEVFFSDMLEKLTWHNDEPLAHPNSVGIALVAQLARGRVKALLSGEAADEFFGGYSRYPLLLLQSSLRKRPVLLKIAASLSQPLGHGQGRMKTLIQALQTARTADIEEQITMGPSFMKASIINDFLGDGDAADKSILVRRSLLDRDGSPDLLTRCQIFDVRVYLPPLLLRLDKMSMAASVENRVPFATPGVFSFAMNLPSHARATLISRKNFLKSCLEGYFPRKYVYRQKKGFGIPIKHWFGGPTGAQRLRSLTEAGSTLGDVIDMRTASSLLANFSGTREQADIAWTLLSLKLWLDIFLHRPNVLDWRRNGTANRVPDNVRVDTLRA